MKTNALLLVVAVLYIVITALSGIAHADNPSTDRDEVRQLTRIANSLEQIARNTEKCK